jgi:hypothetical protein
MPKPYPRTVELCHKLIAKLEGDNEAMSEAYHSLSNDCAVMLTQKDREHFESCQKCRRGLPR